MPTLEFKGKQHIYAHHLTVPHRPLVPDAAKSYPSASATRTKVQISKVSRSRQT